MPRGAHDAYFQSLLEHPDVAVAAFQAVLPDALVRALDWSTLRPEPTVSGDTHGDALRSDWVFSVRGADDGPLLLHLHAEHQRRSERLMPLRTGEYALRAMRRWARAERKRTGKTPSRVPPVLTVVVYNGEHPWRVARSLDALTDPALISLLGDHLLRGGFVLLDLTDVDEDVLLGAALHAHLRLGLWALAAARRDGGWDRLERWFHVLAEVALMDDGLERIRALLTYWGTLFGAPPRPVYDDLVKALPAERRHDVQTWFETIEERGFERGLEKGLETGRQQGQERGMLQGRLLTLLEVRFGPAATDLDARVRAATDEQLCTWLGRAKDAATLDAVFAE